MMRALDVGQSHWSASDLDRAKCPGWLRPRKRTFIRPRATSAFLHATALARVVGDSHRSVRLPPRGTRAHFASVESSGRIPSPRGSQGDAKHRPETRGVAALLTMRV